MIAGFCDLESSLQAKICTGHRLFGSRRLASSANSGRQWHQRYSSSYWQGTRESGACKCMAHRPAVWAFDFDGVVCDSVGESSVAAWKAAARVWPNIFESGEAERRKGLVLEGMRAARPVIETGYENIVQVRCLLEGVSVPDILENWHTLLPKYMEKWGLDRTELVETFGSTRDEWMAADLQGWLEMNGIYEGVPAILQHAIQHDELYVVTTKQARFTEALLKDRAKLSLPANRIFSQAESGKPKTEVLQMLEERHAGAEYHFVEDKLSTLEKVLEKPALDRWKLYLVDWGYNTDAERKRAAGTGKIAVVNKPELKQQVGAA